MRKKKALIVGGSGQIGLYLSKYLLKKNYFVYVTTRKLKKKTIKNVNFLGLKDKINYKIYGKKLIERLINFYLKN